MKIRIWLAILCPLSLFSLGCSGEQPPKMGQDEFSDLYGRMLLISESIPVTSDSLARVKRQKLDALFAEFRTTESDFRMMVEFYKKKPVVWVEILKKAAQNLDSLRKAGPRAGINDQDTSERR